MRQPHCIDETSSESIAGRSLFTDQALSRPKSIVKDSGGTETDGADEKMLPSDDKVPEVVVFGNETKSPQNGDAKLDIGEFKGHGY